MCAAGRTEQRLHPPAAGIRPEASIRPVKRMKQAKTMARLNVVLNFLGHYKYLIVMVLGCVMVGFVDDNSLMRRVQLQMQIDDLEEEIEHYRAINDADTRQLRELRRNPKAIEKIARERYFMKADDEDIFVLSDDAKPETETNDETTE